MSEAGRYPDPWGRGQRYWYGNEWTGHSYSPVAPPATSPAVPNPAAATQATYAATIAQQRTPASRSRSGCLGVLSLIVIVAAAVVIGYQLWADSNELPEGLSAECAEAFETAANKSDMEDTLQDLWPAFDECSSVEEFGLADSEYLDALDGADPATYVANQCAHEPTLAASKLCATSP